MTVISFQPCLTAELDDLSDLDWYIGTWTAETTLRQDDPILGNAGTQIKRRQKVRWAAEKKAIISERFSTANGKTVAFSVNLLSVDPEKNCVVSRYVDLNGTLSNATWSKGNKSEYRISYRAVGPNGERTGTVVMRVTEIDGKEKYTGQFTDMKSAGQALEDGPVVEWTKVK